MQTKLILIIVFVLAAFLRLWQLNSIPPSLNWDEVSLGYNSFSVLKTGRDEWEEILPLSFRAYGDYKLPGYVYLDIPFIAIFGLNEWGVRLPAAFLGIGLVALVILILRKVSTVSITIWGGFLAAILPWSIITSRIALEATLALFLTTLGFYFFLLGINRKVFLYFCAISFGLTIFSYNSSRVVTPLLIIVLACLYWNSLKKVRWISVLALCIFLVFFAVALPKALLQDSSARYRWTTILDEGAINYIEEQRRISTQPPFLARLTFNKVAYSLTEVSKNYASHFNPNFLFLNGGSNYQFSVPGSGLLFPFLAPFLLLGIWKMYKERKKWQLAILLWLLIAPIPAAITRDSPHALRSLMLIPPLVFITSLGLDLFINFSVKKKLWKVIIVVILIYSLFKFWDNYSGDYKKIYSWSWQYGYKEVADYIKKYEDEHESIYVTKKYGEPHEFLLFYLSYDPIKYREDPKLIRYSRSDWFWVDGFDKFTFLNDWEILEKTNRGKGLLITSPENYPEGSRPLHAIYFLDGKKAFDIVELPQVQ